MNLNTLENATRRLEIFSATFVVASLLLFSGCRGEDSAQGEVEAINRSAGALPSADLASVNGTYGAGCANRSGAWSLPIAGGATRDNPLLTVGLNDTGCALTLTEFHTSDGIIGAEPPIALAGSYAVGPSSFGDPIAFYANARLSSVLFASDFTVTIAYSDDPAFDTAMSTARFAVLTSRATPSSVPSRAHWIDPSGLNALTDAADVASCPPRAAPRSATEM